ncbi:MAG TPA: peroxidase family protein [Vicinamibacterales bacterium]|nr:peroxidase family protein [Vicinamibacterales bacterium]
MQEPGLPGRDGGTSESTRAGLGGDLVRVREEARRLVDTGDMASLARALTILTEATVLGDADGETHHLLGLVQFLQEDYQAAQGNLEAALVARPDQEHWVVLLERARRNVINRIADAPEPTERFDNRVLAQPAATFLREPVDVAPLPPPAGVGARIAGAMRDAAGGVVESVLRLVLAFATRRGVAAAWQETFALPDGNIMRDLKLGGIRNWMNAHTLQSAYPIGRLVANQPPGQQRPAWTERFRTANGMWTTDDPAEGAAGARFQWQGTRPMAEIRVNRATDPALPNVREVSRAFLHPRGERIKAPFLNVLTIWWIQFQLHGWLNHRLAPISDSAPYRVPLAPDDPLRERYGLEALTFSRTQADATNDQRCVVYQNEVTGWWDASQIYGNDQRTQDLIRTDPRHPGVLLPGGRIYLEDGLLPRDERGREISGFTRNWNIGLSVFHTLFVREHNHVCHILEQAYPRWSTDQLFHTARLITAAVMAKVHTVEWTPAVLPVRAIALGMSANWNGLIDAMVRPFGKRKALNAFDITSPILGGIVGGRHSNHGVPNHFTEQFAEVYRLHAGIPDALEFRPVGADALREEIPIDRLREQGAPVYLRKLGLPDVINSFGYAHMPALVNNNMPRFMVDMSVEGMPVTDLGAADILRARERGVPLYNEFRRQLGMAAITSFEDLRCDAETVARLEQVYGRGHEGVERLDLAVGMLCDRDLPLAGFDNVRFAIFLQIATRRLEVDPFYCEKYNARYYTQEGIDYIDRANFKDMLLRHCPELARTGLAGVNNAFEPWGTTAASAPEEHPLTAFAERY